MNLVEAYKIAKQSNGLLRCTDFSPDIIRPWYCWDEEGLLLDFQDLDKEWEVDLRKEDLSVEKTLKEKEEAIEEEQIKECETERNREISLFKQEIPILKDFSDDDICGLYSQYSHQMYCFGVKAFQARTVQHFREWLTITPLDAYLKKRAK